MNVLRQLTYLSGTALLALSTAAMAQSGVQDGSALGDIVVTATKRAQTLQEVPISVGVVSGDQLAAQGVRDFTDLQSGVPNMQIDNTNGNHSITIRGLGSSPQNLAFESSVGLFVDGVFSGRARSLQVPLLDVERVEVVRGPQGGLFGKNTNAGAISVVTKRPTRELSAEMRLGGEFSNKGIAGSAIANVPVTDTIAVRISGQAGESGGYIHNRLTDNHEGNANFKSVRGQILWEPTSDFEALAKVEAFRNLVSGSNAMFSNIGDPPCVICDMVQNASGGADAQVSPGFWRTSRGTPEEYDITKSRSMVLTLTWRPENWEVQSITGHQRVSSSRTFNTIPGGLPLLNTLQSEKSTQFSQELRASVDVVDNINLTLGGSYIHVKTHILQDVWYTGNAAGLPLPDAYGHRPFDQKSDVFSPYAILDMDVTPEFNLNATVRYSYEDKEARAQHSYVGERIPANQPDYDLTGKRKEKLWDYSFSARYQFAPDVSAYVRYGTGTKGGGFISNSGTVLYDILYNNGSFDFGRERARSWEVGAKTRFFDRRLDIDIAVFHTKFSGLQVSSYNGETFLIGNAAEATSKGVELETRFRPTEFLSGGFAGAYLDAKYGDYPGGPCLWDAPASCTPLTNNLKGARLMRAPEWKATGFLQIDAPLTGDIDFNIRGSADYTARSFYQGDLNPGNSMPGYTRFDGRIGIRQAEGQWELALIGRNLTNKVYWSQAFNTPILGNNSHIVMVAPSRTITLEGVVRF